MTALLYQKLNDCSVDEKPTLGESTCKSLLGDYEFPLHREYVYIDEQDIKATSYEGSWKAGNCERGEQEDTFILDGYDTTTHKVEIKLDNNYEYIANAKWKYPSAITVGKDGRLVDRTVSFIGHKEPEKTEIGPYWTTRKDDIMRKFNEYVKIVNEKYHEADGRMHCTATLGKDQSNRDVIASICPGYPGGPDDPGYIRVMVKNH